MTSPSPRRCSRIKPGAKRHYMFFLDTVRPWPHKTNQLQNSSLKCTRPSDPGYWMEILLLLLVGLVGHIDGATKNQTSEEPTISTIVPANNKIFQKQDAKQAIIFEWSPVTPTAGSGTVVYHLKIWQVKQGQTPAQAAKLNAPAIEKDIQNTTETTVPPGSLPRMAKSTFVWTVQASDQAGTVYAVSKQGTFSIQSADITITSFTVRCGPTFGNYTYALVVANYGNSAFSIASLALSVLSGGTLSSVTYLPPPAGVTVNSGGNSTTFTGSFSYSGTYSAAVIATIAGSQVGNPNLSSTDTDSATLDACVCNTCNTLQWHPGTPSQTLQGNSIHIIQPFNPAGLGNIVAVKAEIIQFQRFVDDNCMTCTKDWNEWGNFRAGTYATVPGTLGTAVAPLSGNTHHSMYWSNATGFPLNSSFDLNISTPALSDLTCCCDRISLLIRFTCTFRDPISGRCTVCSVVKVYGAHKGTCPRDTGNNSTATQ